MSKDFMLDFLDEFQKLKARVAELEARERNPSYIVLTDGITAPTAVSGLAFIYVDTADDDLKVRFGDGDIVVIAANP